MDGKKATSGAGGETFAKHYCALTFVKMTFIQEQLKPTSDDDVD